MSTLAVGDEVAGIRIDELAGHGGSSVVYRGTDTVTGETMAVKVLRDPGASALRRMRREAELLARFDHEGVVRFRSLEDRADDLVLITSWVDGESLRAQQRTGLRSGHDEALAVLMNLAAPLDHLHAASVVHRDVTPANIICAADGALTLIDLGIGHEVGSATLTNHDLVAGTPRYLAPEIIRGESATARSDQYSLAVIVYELAVGQSPFPEGDEIATALHHQLNTVATPLNELDPAVPGPFAAAVERALSKDPSDRFASIGDFAHAAKSAAQVRAVGTRSRVLAALIVAAAVAVLTVILWPVDAGDVALVDADQAVAPVAAVIVNEAAGVWRAGDASALSCNALEGHDFENGSVPLDFFGDPPGRERVVEAGGYDDSWALEVGIENGFSQYAEIVPVTGGQSYRFQGWFAAQGEIAVSQIGITLFDESNEQLVPEARATLRPEAGFSQVELTNVPATAAFALPWIYKDSSPGVLLADELVFGPSALCTAEIAGS